MVASFHLLFFFLERKEWNYWWDRFVLDDNNVHYLLNLRKSVLMDGYIGVFIMGYSSNPVFQFKHMKSFLRIE